MRKRSWDDGNDDRWFEKLFLPPKLKADLAREADAAWARRVEREQVEEAAQEAVVKAVAKAAEAAPVLGPKLFFIDAPVLQGHGPRIDLLDRAMILREAAKLNNVGLGDKQRKEWAVKTIEHVAARGVQRVVHCHDDWKPALDALRLAHANFAPVLDLIEDELTLAVDQPITLPPLLLNGPPGCGKTFFAQRLAEFFGTGFERVSMETTQTSAELSGTAAHWSNAAPGRLFNRLIDHDYANPVFLLDEIDKAGGDESHRSDKALYALLERETARRWSDTAFPGLCLDASHVIWVLTSNDASEIPGPLLTRMQRFDIEPLSLDDARQLVQTLYRQEVERFQAFGLSPDLAFAPCNALCQLSPRVVTRIVHRLVARLVRQQRSKVEHRDLEAVGALDQASQGGTGRKAIGFLRPRSRPKSGPPSPPAGHAS